MKIILELIITAIDYDSSRGYPDSFVPKNKRTVQSMEIDYSKRAIDFAAELLYNVSGIVASNWIKFVLLSYNDDLEKETITITYSCMIPYKELINGYQWN